MKLKFVTGNKHKFKEMKTILKDYGIELEQVKIDYAEDKEDTMSDVAKKASKMLADELKEPVIVEDTGIFFKACNNFPGAQPKFVVNGIGLDGILRLLKGQDRGAYFKTVIGYCEPSDEPVIFDGVINGKILDEIIEPEVDAMPYDHIFIPEGKDKAIVKMTLDEKNSISQRGIATRKLGEYLKNKNNVKDS